MTNTGEGWIHRMSPDHGNDKGCDAAGPNTAAGPDGRHPTDMRSLSDHTVRWQTHMINLVGAMGDKA